MSKSRDIADSAATINFIDNLTSDAQTQLNTLDTEIDNISVTSGSLTKTFVADEVATITLSGNVLSPVVGVTKEVAQTGTTNNSWDVNSTTENYTRLDSAPATTLDFNFSDNVDSTFTSANTLTVSSQDSVPRGAVLSNDGTKMFVCGDSNNVVLEYALSTAYDLSSATYTQQFDVSSQTTDLKSIAFKPDGTEFYISGGGKVVQYSLSTAWDISTSSHTATVTLSGYTNIDFIVFSADGTSLIFTEIVSTSYIWKFNLSTAWSISTASYNSGVNISSTVANGTARGLAINSDGTKFYVATSSNNIKQFSTSTAYNVSGLSFDNKTSQTLNSGIWGIFFTSDFSRLYVTTTAIHEYTNAITSLTLGSGSFASADVGKTIEANSGVFVLTSTAGAISETTAPTSYAQVASGSWEMYAVVYNTTDGDLEISNLNDVYNLSGATLESELSTVDNTPNDLFFKNDGTELYVLGRGSDVIRQKTLSTAWDITTAGSASSYSFAFSDAQGLFIRDDGLKFFIIRNADNLIRRYSMSTAWDITTGSFDSNTFDVGTQDGDPLGVFFKSDGLKFWVVGNTTNTVYQYSMSSAWNLGTASYDSKSLNVGTEASTPTGIFFKSDGTELYLTDDSSNTIYKYGLTTAWDISTASYSNVSFGVTAGVQGIYLRDGGLNFYTVDSSTDEVYQYSMGLGFYSVNSGYHAVHTTTSTDSTYWTDINSMTADEAAGDGSIYYAVSTDDRATWKIAHNTDGIRSIVRNNSGTWQYNSNGTYASTTWTNATTNTELNALQEAVAETVGYLINSLSYDSVSFDASAQETNIYGLAFNADGTAMYTLGYGNDTVYQYTLSTAYDITTASYASKSFSVSSQDTTPVKVSFNTDGTKMFVLGSANDSIFQYSLSTGFDVSTASYDSVSFSVASQETSPAGMVFNNDGTKMFIIGSANDAVYQYSLSTAFDLSTASYASISFSVASQATFSSQVLFNSDGTKMFVLDNTNPDAIYQYSLSTSFDVSTASYDSVSADLSAQTTSVGTALFNGDGTKLLIASFNNGTIYQYSSTSEQARTVNQMNKTQLDAVSDANHFTLGNDLDLAIVFNLTSGTTAPSSDGVSINYDANVLNKGAILGTDYNYDAPAQNKVRITALTGNNLKVRVV